MYHSILKLEEDKPNIFLQIALTILIIILLSFLVMTITFTFSSGALNLPLFKSYFTSIKLILMNIIPIFIFMSLTYLIFNRLWTSFALTNILFTTLSMINKFKLMYRDDPFTITDITLVSESRAMAGRYEISLSINMIILIIGLILITIGLKVFFKFKIYSAKLRITLLIALSIISTVFFKGVYFKPGIYESIGDKSLINIWSSSQQFQSKGFVYPFIYSITDVKDSKLEGYNEEKAIEDLFQKEYLNIPEEEKVNIITIMLEAYNDFSKFDGVEIDPEVYENFHIIKNESIHGNLITNVFGGDTINTERSFLTGYNSHPRYVKDTNSFIWYLNEQGYRTEATHPIYGWFYNRRNVNEYLGFQNFDYYENKYEQIQEKFFDDMEFFDYIIEGYENSKKDREPYFHFSVTYQNHGPYSPDKLTDKEYLKRKPNYDEYSYNIVNNYLSGISKTDKALKKLLNYFKSEKEPVIIILFGDHNPWLGEDSSGYKMMDINIDLSQEEGFRNYYETPYIIWGNDTAKKIFNKSFEGKGNDIGPDFLMAELFEYLEWGGNEYMQYIIDFKKHIDVNHKVYFKENGKYTDKLSPSNKKRYEDFQNVEYYYSRNFRENKSKKN